jgi:hypothetical protein
MFSWLNWGVIFEEVKEKMCLIYGEDNKKCFYEEPVIGLLWPEI